MGCLPKLSHPTYGYGTQNKDSVVIARVSEGIDYLVEHNAKNYHTITDGILQSFDPTTLPPDLVRCNEAKCHMTGTLWLNSQELSYMDRDEAHAGIIFPAGTPGPDHVDNVITTHRYGADQTLRVAGADYRIRGDFSTAVFGFNFLYLDYLAEKGGTLTVTIADYDDDEFTNSYNYTVQLPKKTTLGFEVFQIALGDPMAIKSQKGTGWVPTTPSTNGIHIKYTITLNTETYADSPIGLSSIKFICDKSELHKADNVILSCIQSIAPNISVDATDASCFGQQYDKDSANVEFSVEARTRSKNDYWLNPFERKGDKIFAPLPKTKLLEVKPITIDGRDFGYFHLPDLSSGCNSIIVSLGEECEGIYLEPLQAPQLTSIDETEFIAIYQESSEAFGDVYVEKRHIGKKALVTYDADTEVDHFIADGEKMDSFESEFIVPLIQDGGIEEYVRFYALVTEHSMELNNTDEASLSLTLSVVRKNGKWYDRYRKLA